MRLNLHWRGRDVIDVELHVWRMRPDDEPERPKLAAAPGLQASELAENFGDPDTIAGFGFGRPAS